MALVLENANKVRQKARLFNIDPAASRALKSFFLYWSEQKSNADLQILSFSEAEADAANGTLLLAGTAAVPSDTDNYFKIFDDATDDQTTTDQRLVLPLFTSQEAAFYGSAIGLSIADGVVVTQHTTSEGVTDGSNGGSGFVIVSAP